MRGKWLLISVAAVVAGIAAGAYSIRHRKALAPAPRASGAAVLNTSEVTLTGSIRPQHVAGVAATVPGNIEAFMVEVGADVFQGQVLARVGSGSLESSRENATSSVDHAQELVTRAETNLNAARLESSRADADSTRARLQMERTQKVFERQTTLHAAGATPKMTYEKAKSDFEAAQREFDVMDKAARGAHDTVLSAIEQVTNSKKLLAEKSQDLEDAQAQFQAAEIRSPVDGTVVGRKGEVGKPAEESGDQLFQIATDLYALEVALDPQPGVLKRIVPGQQALVLILDLQSAAIPAEVKEVKGTQVIVQFNSPLPAVRPGMRADVRLKLE